MRSRAFRRRAILVAAIFASPGVVFPQWAAEPGTTVRNEFGPLIGDGATTCRGACGGGCHPANCEQNEYWVCSSPSHFTVVRTYECGTNDGCREHDDCLDECSRRYPGSGRDPGLPGIEEDWLDNWVEHAGDWNPMRNFYFGECSRWCHVEGFAEHGPKTVDWARGNGPFDGHTVFEYTVEAPGQEEVWYRCPDGFRLVCENGRARCKMGKEPGEGTPVGVVIDPPDICNDPDVPLSLSAEAVGLHSPNVTWRVLSGPGSISSATGELTPQGEGTVVVEAVSVSDSLFRDQVAVYFGRCECSFEATLSGDTNRGTVGGLFAVFSTRGQASIMAVSAGGPEYWEDLASAAEMAQGMQGLLDGEVDAEAQKQASRFLDLLDPKETATPGSTLGLVLIEGSEQNPVPGGLGGGFKLEVLAEGAIGPGFSGALPVRRLGLHTGEFAEEGGAPWATFWEQGDAGTVTLMVEEYDGTWMRGGVEGSVPGVAGLLINGRRPQFRFRASFTAGIYNPLRMENACLMGKADDKDIRLMKALMGWADDTENEK